MSRPDSDKIPREVTHWLEKREIGQSRYDRLSASERDALNSTLTIPSRHMSFQQQKDIYRKLCGNYTGGRDAVDPLDFMPPEELERFYTPVAPSETLREWEKY